MQKIRIPPASWTEEDGYCLILLCCPRDAEWIGIVKGRLYELSTGRVWDERTGRVTDAQAIAKGIWESVCMACTDVFGDINANLAALLGALMGINSTLVHIAQRISAEDIHPLTQYLMLIENAAEDSAYNLQLIGDKLSEQTTMLETRSIAETTGLNTNFTNLITALGNVAARLSPANANSIYAALGNIGGSDQGLLDALELIGDAVRDMNVMLETRSVAETVAQNTNFADLIAGLGSLAARVSPQDASSLYAAISALQLTCAPEITVQSASPDVNLTCAPTINVNCGGSGTQLEGEGGTEGGTPPAGYEQPNPNTVNRKCKAANMVWDVVNGIITKLQVNDADSYGKIGIAGATSLVGALIGSVAFPFGTLVGAVVGAIAGIVIALVTETALNLSDISTLLETHHEDLICILYNSTSADTARDGFLDLLESNGLTNVERAFLTYLLPNNLLNLLFFSVPGLEDDLDGYQVSVTCEGCSGANWFEFAGAGQQLVNGSFQEGTTGFTINAYEYAGLYNIGIYNISQQCLRVTVNTASPGYVPRQGYIAADWLDCNSARRSLPTGTNVIGHTFCIRGNGGDFQINGWSSDYTMTFNVSTDLDGCQSA